MPSKQRQRRPQHACASRISVEAALLKSSDLSVNEQKKACAAAGKNGYR